MSYKKMKAEYLDVKSGALRTKRAINDGFFKMNCFLYAAFRLIGNIAFIVSFAIAVYAFGTAQKMPFMEYMSHLWNKSKFSFFGLFFLSLVIALLIRFAFMLISKIFEKMADLQANPVKLDMDIRKADVDAQIMRRSSRYRSVAEEMEAFRLSTNYYAG